MYNRTYDYNNHRYENHKTRVRHGGGDEWDKEHHNRLAMYDQLRTLNKEGKQFVTTFDYYRKKGKSDWMWRNFLLLRHLQRTTNAPSKVIRDLLQGNWNTFEQQLVSKLLGEPSSNIPFVVDNSENIISRFQQNFAPVHDLFNHILADSYKAHQRRSQLREHAETDNNATNKNVNNSDNANANASARTKAQAQAITYVNAIPRGSKSRKNSAGLKRPTYFVPQFQYKHQRRTHRSAMETIGDSTSQSSLSGKQSNFSGNQSNLSVSQSSLFGSQYKWLGNQSNISANRFTARGVLRRMTAGTLARHESQQQQLESIARISLLYNSAGNRKSLEMSELNWNEHNDTRLQEVRESMYDLEDPTSNVRRIQVVDYHKPIRSERKHSIASHPSRRTSHSRRRTSHSRKHQ